MGWAVFSQALAFVIERPVVFQKSNSLPICY